MGQEPEPLVIHLREIDFTGWNRTVVISPGNSLPEYGSYDGQGVMDGFWCKSLFDKAPLESFK